MADFTQCTATELTDLYRSGSVSPVTVAEQVLAKIERLNPVLNAFCFTDPDTTLSQARASAQRWQQHQPLGLLDGVPVSIKDSILTQGWPTRYASRSIDPNQDWLEDAPVVSALREAGTIFVGKTTMCEFGLTNYNSNSVLYGSVPNPWNLAYSPGGSSGGSAVAVAAGITPLSVVTDMGGSAATPSAFCGVYGFKPTLGMIPRYPYDIFGLGNIGLMSRSVEDLKSAFELASTPNAKDWTLPPLNQSNHCYHGKIKDLKFAVVKKIDNETFTPQTLDPVNTMIDWLTDQGATVDEINLDFDAISLFGNLFYRHLSQMLEPYQHKLVEKRTQHIMLLTKTNSYLFQYLQEQKKIIVKLKQCMQFYDFVIAPATVSDASNFRIAVNVDHADSMMLNPFAALCSISQQPTVTVPIGLNQQSVPSSVTISAAVGHDRDLLQFCKILQHQFPMPHSPFF